jgi:4-methyl-5(b-hydroxyethyl)-thiazole monophosphate biosynthesis
MNKPVYIFLANGFEDIEAIATIDICRRAGIDIKTVSITGSLNVETAHGIKLQADMTFEEGDFSNAAMLVLPGGLPGSQYLNDHEGLREVILQHHSNGTYLAAICAAPMVYGNLGLLNGKRATCYPGFEKFLTGATYTAAKVECDGQFITGKGPGAFTEFARRLAIALGLENECKELYKGMFIN